MSVNVTGPEDVDLDEDDQMIRRQREYDTGRHCRVLGEKRFSARANGRDEGCWEIEDGLALLVPAWYVSPICMVRRCAGGFGLGTAGSQSSPASWAGAVSITWCWKLEEECMHDSEKEDTMITHGMLACSACPASFFERLHLLSPSSRRPLLWPRLCQRHWYNINGISFRAITSASCGIEESWINGGGRPEATALVVSISVAAVITRPVRMETPDILRLCKVPRSQVICSWLTTIAT